MASLLPVEYSLSLGTPQNNVEAKTPAAMAPVIILPVVESRLIGEAADGVNESNGDVKISGRDNDPLPPGGERVTSFPAP